MVELEHRAKAAPNGTVPLSNGSCDQPSAVPDQPEPEDEEKEKEEDVEEREDEEREAKEVAVLEKKLEDLKTKNNVSKP